MMTSVQSQLKSYYEDDASRFWSATNGFVGRDIDVYPLTKGYRGSILEYGCGSGSLLLNLALEDRFTHACGVDISSNALAAVRNSWQIMSSPSNVSKLSLLEPVNDHLPTIRSNTYDLLVSVATIEHVINPYTVLDELHRIGKPDSTLICSVPNYAYIKHRVQLLFGIQPRTGTDEPVNKWRKEGWDGMHLHTFTHSSFSTLLVDCGWKPIKWSGGGTRFNRIGLGPFRRNFPGLLSGELIALCKKI